MAEPDVDLKGLLERNTPGLDHTTSYRLDNVTIEVDLSEVGGVDESLAEGLPSTDTSRRKTFPRRARGGCSRLTPCTRMSQAVERRSPVPLPPPEYSEVGKRPPGRSRAILAHDRHC
jgi:hypothetical protein